MKSLHNAKPNLKRGANFGSSFVAAYRARSQANAKAYTTTSPCPSYRPPNLIPYKRNRPLLNRPIKIYQSDQPWQTRNMSDEAYSSFLDKANQDTGASTATQKESPLKTRAVDTEIPAALKGIESYYTSEADEPWEPVSLKFEGDALGEKEFGEHIGHQGEVSEMTAKEFDPKGQYEEVLEAVGKVGKKTKIFRVEGKGSRVEYYVVGVDEKAGRIVGMKALAVES